MIYILDAYNVIHKTPSLESQLDQNLQAARAALIALCRKWIQSRGDITKIILVFDGRSEFRDLPQASYPKIELIFSETGETADEKIIEVLQTLGKERELCVVSDDNSVRNQTRAYKKSPVSVADFFARMQKNARIENPKSNPREDSLSPRDANDITAHYKKQLGLN